MVKAFLRNKLKKINFFFLHKLKDSSKSLYHLIPFLYNAYSYNRLASPSSILRNKINSNDVVWFVH